MVPKIGVHSCFGPNFSLEFEQFECTFCDSLSFRKIWVKLQFTLISCHNVKNIECQKKNCCGSLHFQQSNLGKNVLFQRWLGFQVSGNDGYICVSMKSPQIGSFFPNAFQDKLGWWCEAICKRTHMCLQFIAYSIYCRVQIPIQLFLAAMPVSWIQPCLGLLI